MQITPGICDSGCFCSVISRGKSPLVSAFLGVSFWALPGRFWLPLFGHPPEANHPCNLIPAASFWVPIFDHFWRQIPPNICDLACILGSNLDQLWEATPPQGLRFRGSPCFPPLPPLPSPPFPLPNPTASEQAGRQDRVAPSVEPLVSSHRFCAIVASSIAWLHRWGVLFRTKLVVRF